MAETRLGRLWAWIQDVLVRAGRKLYQRRTALLAFGAGATAGILMTYLALQGWPLPTEDDLEGDVLVVLSGQDDGVDGQRQRLIETWNALNPDRRAELRVLPASADAQHSGMLAQAQSGSSDVDVFNLDVTWTAEFAAAGYIRSLKGVNEDGFLAKPLQTCRYEGNLWALPFNTDAGLLFFNEKRLREAYSADDWKNVVDPARHPPSWTAIRNSIDAVLVPNRPAGDPLRSGYTAQFDNYEGLTVNALEAVWEAGGQVVNEDGKVVFGEPAARQAMRVLAQRLTNAQVILPQAREQDESASRESFENGQVLFMRNWPVAYRQLTEQNEGPGQANPNPPPGITTLPGPSALGGQNLAVASRSKHPEAAQDLIEFLTNEASQQVLFQDGGLASTRLRTYKDPEVADKFPYAGTLLRAVNSAELRPVTPHYWLFSQMFRQVVLEVLENDGEITDAQIRLLERALEGRATPS